MWKFVAYSFGILAGLGVLFALLESICKTDAQRKSLRCWIKLMTFLGITVFMTSTGSSLGDSFMTAGAITLIVHFLISPRG